MTLLCYEALISKLFVYSVDLTLGNEFRYFVHQNEAVPISNEAGPKDYQNFSTIVSLFAIYAKGRLIVSHYRRKVTYSIFEIID